MKKLGRVEDALITDFPGLTLFDLDATWDDYRAHTKIDDAIAAEETES